MSFCTPLKSIIINVLIGLAYDTTYKVDTIREKDFLYLLIYHPQKNDIQIFLNCQLYFLKLHISLMKKIKKLFKVI